MKRKVLTEIKSREMKFLINLVIFQYYNRFKDVNLYTIYIKRVTIIIKNI